MSRSLTDRLRRLHETDDGFGLIEIMISFVIFAVVIIGTTPLLVGGLKAGRIAQLNLQGKALAQERLEIMRNLPFHVARSNGAYLDVLDIYFRDTTAVGALAVGDICAQRSYDAASSTYSCRITNLGPDYPGFAQTVRMQFLDFERIVQVPLPAYNSQSLSGADRPQSSLLGVTVTTSWTLGGEVKTYVLRSQIANSIARDSLIRASLQVSALTVTSELEGGDVLELEAGLVSAEGTQTTGSSASLNVVAARAERSSGLGITGSTMSVQAPPATTGSSADEVGQSLGGTCELACFGQTTIDGNKVVSIAGGEPKISAPTTNQVTARLRRTGANVFRGYTYNNAAVGSAGVPAGVLGLIGPMVSAGIGSTTEVASGSGDIDATGSGATAVRSTGAVTLPKLELFPTVLAPAGVVQVELTNASLQCASTGGVTATWSGVVRYRSGLLGGYVTLELGPGKPPLPDPATLTVSDGNPLTVDPPLSAWVSSWSALTNTASAVEATGTLSKGTVPAVLSILTQPTRTDGVGNPDLTSQLNVSIGSLTCLAEDNR